MATQGILPRFTAALHDAVLKGVFKDFPAAQKTMTSLMDIEYKPLAAVRKTYDPKNGSWLIAVGAEVACLRGNGTRFSRSECSPSG